MADLVANSSQVQVLSDETDANQSQQQQAKPWQFQPGKSGNPKGRPKGSKNALGQAFVDDLYADWQANGMQVIETVRTDKPDVYLKVIAQIIPRDIDVNVNVNEMTPEQIIARIRQLDKQLQPIIDLVPVNDD